MKKNKTGDSVKHVWLDFRCGWSESNCWMIVCKNAKCQVRNKADEALSFPLETEAVSFLYKRLIREALIS